MSRSARSAAFAALWTLFLARLLFAASLLPPWQNPDEPDHFAVTRSLSLQPTLDFSHRRNVTVEKEVLQSMAAQEWWDAYGERPPNPLPANFTGVPEHIGAAFNGPTLYYAVASRYLRLFGVEGLLPQYYAVRVLSLLITLATFGVIIAAARAWFDDTTALAAAAIVALLPQFALIGISAGPDPLVFLAGAIIWWQAARLAAGAAVMTPVLLMSLVTIVAVMAKRVAVPLIIDTAVLVVVGVAASGAARRWLLPILGVMAAFAVAGALIAARLLARPEQLAGTTPLLQEVLVPMGRQYLNTLGWNGQPFAVDYFLRFTWQLFESGYLVAGYLRFHAPAVIVALALVTFVSTFARGLIVSVRQGDRWRRVALLSALALIAVQLGSIYGTNYYLPHWGGQQGRFLFPVIGPLAAICALGVSSWRSASARQLAMCACVGLLGVLDVIGWTSTVLTAYVR
jgi:hypothetical protein